MKGRKETKKEGSRREREGGKGREEGKKEERDGWREGGREGRQRFL